MIRNLLQNNILKTLVPLLSLTIALSFSSYCQAVAIVQPWSDWYQLDDEALNGVWFSWKCSDGSCIWRWDNRYTTPVKIKYKFRYSSLEGNQSTQESLVSLQSGTNEKPEFVFKASSLDGVTVKLVEPKFTGTRSSTSPLATTTDADAEKKRILQEQFERDRKIAEARQTKIRLEQEELAERARQKAEEERLKNEREQEERERQARREEEREQEREAERRHEASEQRRYNEQLRKDRDSAYSTLSQPDRISEALQSQNRQLETIREQNRQREERERQAREEERSQKAETDRLQREEVRKSVQRRETERLDKERRERERVALERTQKDEQERKQQQEEQHRLNEKKRLDEEKRIELAKKACNPMTSKVSSSVTYPQEKGNCEGEIHAWLTNTSTQAVSCEVVFSKSGVLQFDQAHRVDIQPGDKVGGSYGGLWECGYAKSDTFRFACVLASDELDCKGDIVRKAGGR